MNQWNQYLSLQTVRKQVDVLLFLQLGSRLWTTFLTCTMFVNNWSNILEFLNYSDYTIIHTQTHTHRERERERERDRQTDRPTHTHFLSLGSWAVTKKVFSFDDAPNSSPGWYTLYTGKYVAVTHTHTSTYIYILYIILYIILKKLSVNNSKVDSLKFINKQPMSVTLIER